MLEVNFHVHLNPWWWSACYALSDPASIAIFCWKITSSIRLLCFDVCSTSNQLNYPPSWIFQLSIFFLLSGQLRSSATKRTPQHIKDSEQFQSLDEYIINSSPSTKQLIRSATNVTGSYNVPVHYILYSVELPLTYIRIEPGLRNKVLGLMFSVRPLEP